MAGVPKEEIDGVEAMARVPKVETDGVTLLEESRTEGVKSYPKTKKLKKVI